MRLGEIAMSATPMDDYSSDDVKSVSAKILAGALKTRQIDGTRFTIVVSDTGHYALFSVDELLGWVKLQRVTLHGVNYESVINTYVVPKARGTRAVAALLLGVKTFTSLPVLVDRAVFGDGFKLLDVIRKRGLATMYVLNKETGELTKPEKHLTSVENRDALVLEYVHILSDFTESETDIKIFSSHLLEGGGVLIQGDLIQEISGDMT